MFNKFISSILILVLIPSYSSNSSFFSLIIENYFTLLWLNIIFYQVPFLQLLTLVNLVTLVDIANLWYLWWVNKVNSYENANKKYQRFWFMYYCCKLPHIYILIKWSEMFEFIIVNFIFLIFSNYSKIA